MRPSTAVELLGFGCLTAAAFLWTPIAGLLVAGGCLLLIGYAIEDTAASLAVNRMLTPARARLARAKVKRQNRRFRRTSERRQRSHRLLQRQPTEILLRVQQD